MLHTKHLRYSYLLLYYSTFLKCLDILTVATLQNRTMINIYDHEIYSVVLTCTLHVQSSSGVDNVVVVGNIKFLRVRSLNWT